MDPSKFQVFVVAISWFLAGSFTRGAAFQLSGALTVANRSQLMPTSKRVAIVIRGEAFRGEYTSSSGVRTRLGCRRCAKQIQMDATNSLINQVIMPLESNGNTVKVIVTDVIFTDEAPHRPLDLHQFHNLRPDDWTEDIFEAASEAQALSDQAMKQAMMKTYSKKIGPCSLTSQIIDALGDRVVDTHYLNSSGQADDMIQALNSFQNDYGGAGHVVNKFDYVLVVRHDLLWHKSIIDTQIDFDKVNFFARCEQNAPEKMGGPDCVWDIIQWMPSFLYSAFSSVIGTGFEPGDSKGCFDTNADPAGPGHPCKRILQQEMKNTNINAKIGFMTDIISFARDHNDYISFALAECD